MPNARKTRMNLQEVTTRNTNARRIIAGFTTDFPTLARFWQQIDTALADTAELCAELTGLRRHLANLAAAARATLAAHDEDETDPLSYLRDELHAQGHDIDRRRA